MSGVRRERIRGLDAGRPERLHAGPTPHWDRAALLASPWLGALHGTLRKLADERFPTLADLNALALDLGVRSGGEALLRFVASGGKARGFDAQYEVRIFRSGEVPTRAGSWHDLFNALVWLAFPRTKAVLNRRHYEASSALCGDALRGTSRGTARDVLTLFDEGGMLVACADPALAELLRGFRWKELFWRRRAATMTSMRFLAFGHAIHEKSLAPFRGVTAKALVIAVAPEALAHSAEAQVVALDAAAAEYFSRPESLGSTRLLSPLPVLGIPGWAPDNADPAYYDDVAQFRPGRRTGDPRDAAAG
ncbi:MAG: DUF3025 domain-containing protein [Burkholderiales bacterium]|nr:DUF3025 domain-containing protein [Burkholderiales bacterium]